MHKHWQLEWGLAVDGENGKFWSFAVGLPFFNDRTSKKCELAGTEDAELNIGT